MTSPVVVKMSAVPGGVVSPNQASCVPHTIPIVYHEKPELQHDRPGTSCERAMPMVLLFAL